VANCPQFKRFKRRMEKLMKKKGQRPHEGAAEAGGVGAVSNGGGGSAGGS
jgi:hypothetical protein